MKVLCVGDIHVKVSNVPEIDEMTVKLINLTKERQPDIVVLLGDILDRHATIHVSCLMRAEKIVLELSKLVPTFVLVGNHDRPNNSTFLTDEHPFNAMKLWPNTYIIDRVFSYIFTKKDNQLKIRLNIEEKEEKEEHFRFVFAPYVPPGRFMEALNTIESPLLSDAIFAHQEIVNAKMGAIISTEGDEWPLNNPPIFSGHIHDYDTLQPNMIYVGVPLMHSFADRPDKAVSLFDFVKSEDKWSQERIDLGLIKKTTVYLTVNQLIDYIYPKDKLVKLVIRGDEAEIKSAAKLEKVQELKKAGVKVVFKTVQSNVENSNKIVVKMNFYDRLMTELSDHELYWFKKIF